MKILFIGDIVGRPGRNMVKRHLPRLRKDWSLDLVVANGENAAGGNGITPPVANELLQTGIDGLTLGNHTWDKKEIIARLDDFPQMVRPANFPNGTPGRGWTYLPNPNGSSLALVNLMGRVYLPTQLSCPFRWFDVHFEQIKQCSPCVLVDFHAEATSEKQALGWYLDGRASVVLGTHTHVQTNDARFLPQGTAYVTDVGMTGPRDSVLGVDPQKIVAKFLTQMPQPFPVAKGPLQMNAVYIELDDGTGKPRDIRNIVINDEGI